YHYFFNEETGELRDSGLVQQVDNPAFLAISSNRMLYAINALFEYKGEQTGAISAFSIDTSSKSLIYVNEQSSKGQRPAYVCIDNSGEYLFVANYGGGSIAVFPIESNGQIGSITDTIQFEGE